MDRRGSLGLSAGHPVRWLLAALFLLVLLPSRSAAEDPYEIWAAGRPAEAATLLEAAAARDSLPAWSLSYDTGLAWAAAGDPGRAAVHLVAAHGAAPGRSEPMAALQILGQPVPATWRGTLGPLALPGMVTAVILGLGGLLLGVALGRRLSNRWRPHPAGRTGTVLAMIGGMALLAGLPSLVATLIDGRTHWVAVVRPTSLLDSAGNPTLALPAGTIAVQEPGEPWAGRIVVRLPNGTRGFLALDDTRLE